MNDKIARIPLQPSNHDGQKQKSKELLQLLQSWLEQDEQEQKETLHYLKRALGEDRLSEKRA